MTGRRLILVIALALVAAASLWLPCGSALAEKCCQQVQNKLGSSTASIPILFATDRAQKFGDGKEIDFGIQVIVPIEAIFYGLKREDAHCNIGDDDARQKLRDTGWLIYPPEATKKSDREVFREQQSLFDKSQVFGGDGFTELISRAKTMLNTAPTREIVIYVHGCCLDYNGSMRQAADLASSVKAPVIAYCWGCSKGYAGSSLAYPRTQERFNKFLERVLAALPNERICVVSNSIGTQLITNFCLQSRPEDYGGRNIDEIILSRADLDDVALKSQLEHINRHAKKVIVYVAKNDFQINVSGTLRWFFYPKQHGERAGHLRSALQSEPSLTVLDVSPLKLGHVIPYDSVADILSNKGDVPVDSKLYHYDHLEDNLYRVAPQMNAEKEVATTSSESK